MTGGGWLGGRGAAGPSRFHDPLRRVRSACLPLSARVSGGLSSPAVCWSFLAPVGEGGRRTAVKQARVCKVTVTVGVFRLIWGFGRQQKKKPEERRGKSVVHRGLLVTVNQYKFAFRLIFGAILHLAQK